MTVPPQRPLTVWERVWSLRNRTAIAGEIVLSDDDWMKLLAIIAELDQRLEALERRERR